VQCGEAVAGWKSEKPGEIGLFDVVFNAKPTVLIGVSGCVRFWLQASTSMPNATPMRATSDPMLSKPTTPPWSCREG
jgi:hypothetical protein